MRNAFKKTLLVTAMGLGFAVASTTASAGFVGAYSGWVEMSDCPLCDSTVSFSVWENTDGNWYDDLDYDRVDDAGSTTGAEKYVYLYQVVNTDHVHGELDENIEDFFVADLLHKGEDSFTGIGWFSGYVFQEADGAVGQSGGNPYAGGLNLGATPQGYVDDSAPDNDAFPPRNNNPVSDSDPETNDVAAGVQSGDVNAVPTGLVRATSVDPANTAISEPIGGVDNVTHVAHWQWAIGDNAFASGETSSVLWAASDDAPMFYWGSSESGGGPGSSGDVPVPEGIPVPAPFLLLGAGLGLMGLTRRRKG